MAAGAATVMVASDAAAQVPCEPYIIQSGDTLRGITERAYGNGNFRPIFEANRNVIGFDPNVIEVGDVIDLPCSNTGTAASAVVIEATPPQPAPERVTEAPEPEPEPETTIAALVPEEPEPEIDLSGPADVRFVTYDGNAPYSGANLPNGGLATELLETAYGRIAPDAEVDTTLVTDNFAFLMAMGSEAYDVGFPSIRPNCNVIETLAVEMIELCAKYAFSEPFHEIRMTAWALNGNSFAGASEPAELSSARICRPEGLFTFDLEADRLPGRGGALVSRPDNGGCFNALLAGEVDLISMPFTDARDIITERGLSAQVAPVPALERGVTLHAVANQSNPDGVRAISRLNRGLEQMRGDGQWFSIVSRQLAAR